MASVESDAPATGNRPHQRRPRPGPESI